MTQDEKTDWIELGNTSSMLELYEHESRLPSIQIGSRLELEFVDGRISDFVYNESSDPCGFFFNVKRYRFLSKEAA